MEEAEHKSKVTLNGDFQTVFTLSFLPSDTFQKNRDF